MEDAMYTRRAMVVTLILLLSALAGAKPVPIGTVTSCNGAAIHGTNLVPGSTIYSGDTIDVGAQGSAWISVPGGGQVQVFENTTIHLTKGSDSIQLTVDRGRAQTNSKGVVIHESSEADGHFQGGKITDERKHNDGNCEVSKDTRKNRPCRDATD
jgi:hypothetical protein